MKATKGAWPPAPAVLIFDGDCSVCTSCANWARRHVKGAVEIAPWQRLDLATYGLTPEDAKAAAWWIGPADRKYRAHVAVGRTLRDCGGWWPLAGWLLSARPSPGVRRSSTSWSLAIATTCRERHPRAGF